MTFRGFNNRNDSLIVNHYYASATGLAVTGIIPGHSLTKNGDVLNIKCYVNGPATTGPDNLTLGITGSGVVSGSLANSTTGLMSVVITRLGPATYSAHCIVHTNGANDNTGGNFIGGESVLGSWDDNQYITVEYDSGSDGYILGLQAWKSSLLTDPSF